ncbi:MAG: hypothetical protein MUF02_06730 [Acidobacteria bacterium]|nr:hypothetical protein [Acidobacteriota bacterium]
MKRQTLVRHCLAIIVAASLPLAATAQVGDAAALFPDLQGWQKDGAGETFMPENLYEHINGAAENFLAYGFAKLAVQNYANKKGQQISAEIYFHVTPENAFGIYSSEKPLAGNYIAVGAQGYVEEGVLNFIRGAYYIKLNGFDLGTEGAGILKDLGERIARSIRGEGSLPPILATFPEQGKVPHSERYIAGNYLGHDFLLPAFTADYELLGKRLQLFIMKTDDEKQARAMLARYAALDKGNPAPVIRPGCLTVNDPYQGSVRLCWRGSYIWGATGEAAAALIDEVGRRLDQR